VHRTSSTFECLLPVTTYGALIRQSPVRPAVNPARVHKKTGELEAWESIKLMTSLLQGFRIVGSVAAKRLTQLRDSAIKAIRLRWQFVSVISLSTPLHQTASNHGQTG